MQTTCERDFGAVALLDIAATPGGTIFVRQVPVESVDMPGGGTRLGTVGAGEVLALDHELSELDCIDVEALVVAHRLDESIGTRAIRVVHDPRGWAMSILCSDKIADFGFGKDEDGRSRTGEAWATYTCEHTRRFSSARYHPTNGDLVFVEDGGPVRTAHGSLEWGDVNAYSAAMDDDLIAAIGPKYLYVYDQAAQAELFRAPVGPGYAVGLLPDRRVAVLAGRKARLRIYDADGTEQLCLVSGVPSPSRIEVSPTGTIALFNSDRLAFVDPATGRVATLPAYVGSKDHARPGQFAWLDGESFAVVLSGTAKLSISKVDDLFATLPAVKWKVEKPKK